MHQRGEVLDRMLWMSTVPGLLANERDALEDRDLPRLV